MGPPQVDQGPLLLGIRRSAWFGRVMSLGNGLWIEETHRAGVCRQLTRVCGRGAWAKQRLTAYTWQGHTETVILALSKNVVFEPWGFGTGAVTGSYRVMLGLEQGSWGGLSI